MKVSLSSDFAVQFFPPCTTPHDYFGMLVPPPGAPAAGLVPFVLHAEVPVPMFWPPGMALGQNKLAAKVLHKGVPITQGGHDCGAAIPHVCSGVPPPATPGNTLLAVHIPFSGRKTNFASSKVISQGKPTGANLLTALPPAPMTSCMDPVSLPTSQAISYLSTVAFSLTPEDVAIGWATLAAVALVEAAFAYSPETPASKAAKEAADKAAKKALEGLSKEAAQKVANEAIRKNLYKALQGKLLPGSKEAWGQWFSKTGIGLWSGVAKAYWTDGPVDNKVAVGSPFAQVEVGYTRDVDGKHGGVIGVRQGILSAEGQAGQGGASGKLAADTQLGSSAATTSGPDHQYHSPNPLAWGAPL